MLSEEIKAEGEYLSFRINVIDAIAPRQNASQIASQIASQNPSQNAIQLASQNAIQIPSQIHGEHEEEEAVVIAQGTVALWVMVEDACNIVRREVDLVASVLAGW